MHLLPCLCPAVSGSLQQHPHTSNYRDRGAGIGAHQQDWPATRLRLLSDALRLLLAYGMVEVVASAAGAPAELAATEWRATVDPILPAVVRAAQIAQTDPHAPELVAEAVQAADEWGSQTGQGLSCWSAYRLACQLSTSLPPLSSQLQQSSQVTQGCVSWWAMQA